MNATSRDKITIVMDIILVFMFLCVLGSIGFNIYSFSEYKKDVRDRRDVLCEASALRNEKYCTVEFDAPEKS